MAVPISNVASHVSPQQRSALLEPLSPAHVASLKAVQAGTLLRSWVPVEHGMELSSGGYVRQTLGGFSPTDLGAARGAMEAAP